MFNGWQIKYFLPKQVIPSCSSVLVIPFVKITKSSRDFTFFRISFNTSFDISNGVVPQTLIQSNLKCFFLIPTPFLVTDATNHNYISSLLAKVVNTVLGQGKPIFINGSRNRPDSID